MSVKCAAPFGIEVRVIGTDDPREKLHGELGVFVHTQNLKPHTILGLYKAAILTAKDAKDMETEAHTHACTQPCSHASTHEWMDGLMTDPPPMAHGARPTAWSGTTRHAMAYHGTARHAISTARHTCRWSEPRQALTCSRTRMRQDQRKCLSGGRGLCSVGTSLAITQCVRPVVD